MVKFKNQNDLNLLEQHYSTIIYRGYLKILTEKYPREKINSLLLSKIGLNLNYLEDHSNWISQEASEEFYHLIEELESGNKDIDFLAGKNSLSKDDIGFFTHFVSSFISMEQAIASCIKAQKRINKVDSLEIIESNKDLTKIKIQSARKTKHIERVANNWKGFLTEFPKLFGRKSGRVLINIIDHCTFEITIHWKKKLNSEGRFLNKRIIITLLFMLVALKVSFLEGGVILGAITGLLACFYYLSEKKEKKSNQNRNTSFEDLLESSEKKYTEVLESKKEIEKLYQKSKVMSCVATKVVEAKSAEEVISLAVGQIHNELGYDQALFFMIDDEGKKLNASVCHGVNTEKVRQIHHLSFNLEEDTENSDHIVNIFKNRLSRRVVVSSDYLEGLSIGTRAFLENSEIKEFFALTVHNHEKASGVLFVASTDSKKEYSQNDFETLQIVSKHLAMSIEKSNHLEEETRLRKLFESYVSTEVISKSGVGKGKNFIRNGEAVILFCDLRGFTQMMNESSSQNETIQVIQRFYEIVTDEVYGVNGFVNKFLGDGALAVFECHGRDKEDAVLKAIAAASSMQKKASMILGHNIKISAGIHCGKVVFATVGKDPKLEYTVLGDAVNVASRLCNISKEMGNLIIISASTVSALSDQSDVINMGEFNIRGIKDQMQLYHYKVKS